MMCPACGTDLPPDAKFCLECGAPLTRTAQRAEYKQVTVLFADVVHSMDIAAAVGAERLREIMSELVSRCATVVQRYGGTVDKFTGDGVMAVFGAPIALEDHASRACLAAWSIQEAVAQLATTVERSDHVPLQLRIGLNSGEVIAGEIGSGAAGYTTIGEQVGMAQRMESVAAPGGVMLSESTARLVEDVAELTEPELVHIKGFGAPVVGRRLRRISGSRNASSERSALVGRDWELAALTAMLDRAIEGRGSVVNVVGPAGIGKSRIVAEVVATAKRHYAQVFSTFCESHTTEVPFHASIRLLRATLGVSELDDQSARAALRQGIPDTDAADLLLLEDELGIREPGLDLPDISPDARRRRLAALVNTLVLANVTPAVFVVEDAHWIDAASESLLADFLSVVPQTHSLVLVTYRPDYHGALSRTPGAQRIALAALDDSQSAELVTELLGPHPSVARLADQIAERAAGNPFFTEQIVRDLADRGVLTGDTGRYVCSDVTVGVEVPATLQAAIAARIDRLDGSAKGTLNAAAVIGMRFGEHLLSRLIDSPVVTELLGAELVDQVRFTPRAEYAFRHPLIRAVAYRSQLKADRAELHRRVAEAVHRNAPESADENAALIAEHLQAAGDLREAYGWLMRAGTWLTFRDIAAARTSWRRASEAADRLPADDPDRMGMRIAPRALACLSAFRQAGTSVADAGFDELRELATAADDKVSLAMGMAGNVSSLLVHGHYREASELGSELINLVESIGDPALMVSLLYAGLTAKIQVGEVDEAIRVAHRMIDLDDGDLRTRNAVIESPVAVALVLLACARAFRGDPGWRDELEQGIAIARISAPIGHPVMLLYKYSGIAQGTVLPDESAVQETSEAFELAQQIGDDFALEIARAVRGLVLARRDGPDRAEGYRLLANAREAATQGRTTTMLLTPMIDLERAREMLRTGDVDSAIELSRAIVDREVSTGEIANRAAIVATLVEALLQRGTEADVLEAQRAIERLAEIAIDPDFALYKIHLLKMRAMLARAQGDESTYQDLAERYLAMATKCEHDGHIRWAQAMLAEKVR